MVKNGMTGRERVAKELLKSIFPLRPKNLIVTQVLKMDLLDLQNNLIVHPGEVL